LFSVRNTSFSRARISRTKALAITGVLAVSGAFVATGIAAHADSVHTKTVAAADATAVSALKDAQAKAQAAPADAAAQALLAQRTAAAAAANRDAQRAAIDTAAAQKAAAQKAAADKAAADKAAADKAAADAAAKAAADKAASDAAAKAAADKAAADAAAQKAAAAKAAATPTYANNLDGWIKQAIAILDQNGTPTSYNAVYQAAIHESAGNPSATNGWDSNAAKGTPSIGLLQVIGPTFNAYKLAGHNDIYNPVDNIIAGARYAADRYGSLDNVVAARCGGSCWFGY
jgi:soluble lytic murein transglycosylase-like protein